MNCHKHLDDLLLRSVTQEGNTSGSGHWIKNSGSSDETRRNSRSFPYIYESSSLSELETFCSSPERDRKKTSSNGTQKREAKKMKKIQKEKNEAKMFEEALGLIGLDFDSEAHVCI